MTRVVVLSLFMALLSVPMIINSGSSDSNPRPIAINQVDAQFTPSAINHNIFPSGSYSYGSWVWNSQGIYSHVQDHGNEFSMGQASGFISIFDDYFSGWFYSDAVSYSGPPLTSVTTEIDARSHWFMWGLPDGSCYYELDLTVQKYVDSTWIDMGTWDNALTFGGTGSDFPVQSKTDWGAGVVDGPGIYRVKIYMIVNPPLSVLGTDDYWLYIEDFAL
jgi:hypothetical protein